jgi:hypothetical protein
MMFPQSIRLGDRQRCDQHGLGWAKMWTSVSPCLGAVGAPAEQHPRDGGVVPGRREHKRRKIDARPEGRCEQALEMIIPYVIT